jgi:hypothetical protein
VRLLAMLMGFLTILVGVNELIDLGMAGFPDSSLTQYDLVVRTPFTILSYASVAAGFYFFCLAVMARRRHAFAHLIVACIVYSIFVPGTYFGIDYYLKNFTDINYGQGG